MEPARAYVSRHLLTDIEHKTLFTDAKTILQEYAQKRGLELGYELLDQSGPDHLKVYITRVMLGGVPYETGQSHSIKGAQMEAAHKTLKKLGITK